MRMRRQITALAVALFLSASVAHVSTAQEQGPRALPPETTVSHEKSSVDTGTMSEAGPFTKDSEKTRMGLVGRFVNDQKQIWTSPARLRFSDADWLAPLSGVTAGLFVT